jgi:hypothetical protein
MKSLLLSTFLLLSLVSFSQMRDEIISRHESGMKNIVITYSGIGHSEKIVKVTEYSHGFLLPYRVSTYGSKIDLDGKSRWLVLKEEYFKNGGSREDKVNTY